jgi:hypothetical protein
MKYVGFVSTASVAQGDIEAILVMPQVFYLYFKTASHITIVSNLYSPAEEL